jgi:hypothetical protein
MHCVLSPFKTQRALNSQMTARHLIRPAFIARDFSIFSHEAEWVNERQVLQNARGFRMTALLATAVLSSRIGVHCCRPHVQSSPFLLETGCFYVAFLSEFPNSTIDRLSLSRSSPDIPVARRMSPGIHCKASSASDLPAGDSVTRTTRSS